jgi:predicted ATPase
LLYKLEIENFFSIKEKQIIDLRAAENAPEDKEKLIALWEGSNERVSKIVSFFGTNASGKTNVVRALSFICWFAGNSFDLKIGNALPFQPFLDKNSQSLPTKLAIELVANEPNNSNQCRYRYEIELLNEPGKISSVKRETLHFWPTPFRRKTTLFDRQYNELKKVSPKFGLNKLNTVLKRVLRPEVSLLSTLAQFQHPFSLAVRNASSSVQSNILFVKSEISETLLAQTYMHSPTLTDAMLVDISKLDIGIETAKVDTHSPIPVLFFGHSGLDFSVPFALESHGTQKFLSVYPLIHHALEHGSIAIIDELDSAIHPMILPEILGWFYSKKRNPKNAQVWLTAQNPTLLENLIKEEIYFCEKDFLGRTTIYGLKEIDKVRREDNYYKKYLSGIYGAVPHIG